MANRSKIFLLLRAPRSLLLLSIIRTIVRWSRMSYRAKIFLLLRALHSLLLWGCLFFMFMLADILLPLIHLFTRDKKAATYECTRLGGKILLLLARVKVEVEGMENIPDSRPIIVMPNHQGHFDYPILFSVIPFRLIYVVRKEFFTVPILRGYLRMCGYYLLDRRAAMSAYQTMGEVAKGIKSGESVLIFPEGETSRDGTVGEFKNGGFHLALHSGVPVLPIAIHGSYNILPSHSWIAHPRQVKVKISKPIYFNRMEKPGFSDISAACKKVRESILKMHSELANLG